MEIPLHVVSYYNTQNATDFQEILQGHITAITSCICRCVPQYSREGNMKQSQSCLQMCNASRPYCITVA